MKTEAMNQECRAAKSAYIKNLREKSLQASGQVFVEATVSTDGRTVVQVWLPATVSEIVKDTAAAVRRGGRPAK
ncbi:hypothetical protein BaRGS_00005355 [Batillaria attramentaria]|uniref:Uncharacterized protein n=1 Tax=Batillaria attramentaria TaxID=370345 RepID=A0ABD0LUY7_9CAEN